MAEDFEGRFRTHHRYIEALAWLGGKAHFTLNPTALTRVARQLGAFGSLDKVPAAVDYDQVHKSLRNAWSTEVLLNLPEQWAKDEDEFVRLSNTWGVVQAYYVGYHSTQALITAKGMRRPTTHPATQQLYATLWSDRALLLPPWTFGACAQGWKNVPAAASIDLALHAWSSCSAGTCWSLAAKALKSTRDAAVQDALNTRRDEAQRLRKRTWQDQEAVRLAVGHKPRVTPKFPRPQLTEAEKAGCLGRVRTYTLLDYLFRLRIGANYDDAAVFTDGPDNDVDSFLLHNRLTFIASGLGLTAETRVRDLVGLKRFYQWADDFIRSNIPTGYSLGIKARRPLL